MAVVVERRFSSGLHPLAALLVAGVFVLFLGALLSDWGYAASYEIQWTNFASWLVAGGLVFGGFALVWALVDLIRSGGGALLYFALLLVTWVLGFINALVHAKDAWAAMPAGLWLSAVTTLLAATAFWIGSAGLGTGDRT